MVRIPNEAGLAAQEAARVRERRYAMERRRQLIVLTVLAAVVLIVSVAVVGPREIFLPGWWHIDLP